MFKVFKGQSALRLTLETAVNLEGVNAVSIKYRRPDKTAGVFHAAVSDPLRGCVFHEFVEGELDAFGWWVFWAYVEFVDGRCAAGESVKVFVWNEGE